MSAESPGKEKTIVIPAELDVTGAVEAHAELVSRLEEVESSDEATLLDLNDGRATPLAVQLVVSATRSFPADRFRLGSRAAAALATCETSVN
ncbi:hypothetical protein [Palleronia sp.]|uniref:hypothetical protein n=1 Tax=Palleronia sp. TaxID=1940284 RepID=UPI0035C80C07